MVELEKWATITGTKLTADRLILYDEVEPVKRPLCNILPSLLVRRNLINNALLLPDRVFALAHRVAHLILAHLLDTCFQCSSWLYQERYSVRYAFCEGDEHNGLR